MNCCESSLFHLNTISSYSSPQHLFNIINMTEKASIENRSLHLQDPYHEWSDD